MGPRLGIPSFVWHRGIRVGPRLGIPSFVWHRGIRVGPRLGIPSFFWHRGIRVGPRFGIPSFFTTMLLLVRLVKVDEIFHLDDLWIQLGGIGHAAKFIIEKTVHDFFWSKRCCFFWRHSIEVSNMVRK